MLKENYDHISDQIADACREVSRDPGEVCLIAVSKTKPAEMIRELYEAGVRDFGENRVQELVEKYEKLPKDIRFHLIGHLQTNKVKYIVDKAYMIHSVDSYKLAREISREAVKKNVDVKVLIEVNMAREESKFGVLPEDCTELIREAAKLPNLSIRGLMTVAPYVTDPGENSIIFRKMRQLSIDIKEKNIDNVLMEFLSMGMSGDFQAAVKEGATHVRVGTAIFGER
ncbi:MAG: YggS family pyridoxal phosphate-dependent enzyme [Lachnospiraceae bacterium]|nr:YggS family pyridoxal phosphate-dependent enzyme [Lachnospiraceae bacterium]